MMAPDKIPEVSPLLDEEMRKQLGDVFSKLEQDVWLLSIVDIKNDKCVELASLLKDMERLSEKIHVELYEPGENPALEKELLDDSRLPIAGIYRDGHVYTGQSFLGVPGGKELNSLVMALYNTAGAGQPLEDKIKSRTQAVDKPVNIQVFVSLACHHCAQTVISCQRMASLNPSIRAQMVDANLFPDYVKKYHIERVPMTVINGVHTLMGGKSLEEVLDFIEKTV
ncbi:MAG: thioredoxin family protein [Lachnospiraceae bacterium]|nr:thioredoxin family protein [Lachnospiraceae bacterium]MDE6980992.1 thioredoxin family protein [Lachnospiraceae bacterium]